MLATTGGITSSHLPALATLSTGPGLMDRPEFRLYVTHAKWNKAAGNVTGEPGYDGQTSGTSFGAQVEVWF